VTEGAAGTGLRGTAVHGAFWNIATAVGNKGVTTVGQVILAWYLFPGDLGVVAMATSVIAWATFFTASGIDDLLVQRHDTYERDAPQILYLCVAFNFLALGVAASLMPFASGHFGDVRVGGLMLIQALAWPISSVTLVLRPKLANQLRFKAIALVQMGQGIVFTVSAVLLAALGLGPYALVWPILLQACFLAGAYWFLSGGRLPLARPRPASWPAYLAPGLLLMIGNFVAIMTVQVPNFIVGTFLGEGRTGLYAQGYVVASQAIFLLVINLRGLFMPLFSKLKSEPARMAEAVSKSAYSITAAVVPICVLQAFLARPLIDTFFPPRWAGSEVVVLWLSVGFVAQPAALIAQAALVAAGKFGFALRLALLQAVLIALGVAWGCFRGDIASVAMGAALAGALGLSVNVWALHVGVACPWSRLADTAKAILYSGLAFLPSYGLFMVFGGRYRWWSTTGEVLLYGLALFLVYWIFDRGIFDSFKGLRKGKPGASVDSPALLGGQA
jgi:teichuronic acid exporter